MAANRNDIAEDGSRRSFLKSVAGVVGGAAIGPYSSNPGAALSGSVALNDAGIEKRPNVLLLHSHDLGRFLNCYGIRTVHTPNLDRFAAEGVLFERSFATAPQCSPSRSSIFTGRYPHCNGVLGLTHYPFCWELNSDELHLGQILKTAGYRTAGVGIIHETHLGPKRCGLDEYVSNPYSTAVADATIEMLGRFARDSNKPFYIQAGTIEPHRLPNTDPTLDDGFIGSHLTPDTSAGVTVPGYLRDTPGTRTELGEIQGSVRHVDSELGRIFDALKQLNLEQNTLVIYTTDHGIAFPRSKCSVYEPGQETAMILRLPGRPGWHGGVREHAMISNIDYLPTILDAVNIPIPSSVQGRSLAPLLDGRSYSGRDAIFYELTYHDYYDPQRAVRTERHKLIVYFSTAYSFMDPSQSWRPRSDTVVPQNHALSYHTFVELYDLERDPWEQHNLAADTSYADVLENLRGLLRTHMEQTGDPILQGAVTGPMHHRTAEWLHTGDRKLDGHC
ncbi:MAG: sulfatase [Terracidiphilus sp.]|jgi:arylsulfatase A-like enzyme